MKSETREKKTYIFLNRKTNSMRSKQEKQYNKIPYLKIRKKRNLSSHHHMHKMQREKKIVTCARSANTEMKEERKKMKQSKIVL